MRKTALITGAGTGIGLQLSLSLLARHKDIKIIAVGRRIEKLRTLSASYPQQVLIIAADVASEYGRDNIVEQLSSYPQIDYLIHAAATAQPLTSIKNMVLNDWRQSIQTNVEAPLFLTKSLLTKCQHSRVIFFTSEVNIQAVEGASAYCVTKVALQMVYESLKTEIDSDEAIFAMVSPGLVDTPMQADIRQADPKELPAALMLSQMYNENQLMSAETVAAFVSWLLLEVDNKSFSEAIWDIYQESHRSHWLPVEQV